MGWDDKPGFLALHPADISPEQQPDGEASFVKAERIFRSMQSKPVQRFDWVHKHRDGHLFPVEVTLSSFEWEGQPALYCVWRDISERDRLLDSLRTNEAYFHALFNGSGEAIMLVGPDGFIDCNPRTLELYGFHSKTEFLSMHPADLSAPIQPDGQDSRVAANARMSAAFESGYQHFEWRHCRRDGTSFDAEVTLSAIDTDKGRVLHAIVIDVSERKRQEQLLAERTEQLRLANIAKSRFLAQMSHEIRTPMNAILGFAQVLAREELNPEHRVMIQHINQSGRSLLGIINDILDYSKIEAGQLSLEIQSFRLTTVLEQVDSLFGALAREKGLELRVEAQPIAGLLLGDALRLEQVLINLIGNAIKFTQAGCVGVRVRPLTISDHTAHLRFEVVDTGIGMAEETLAILFQPFSQADTGIARRFGGTGLGLSISKRLVDLMGGKIGVESVPSIGSTFWFELSFERLANEENGTNIAIEVKGPRLKGLRLLVVDDSQINLLLAEKALTKEGAEVVLVQDGQQAIDCLQTNPSSFDLVLMDIQMPIMDGMTATRAIRQELKLKNLPVIALTAGVLAEEKKQALDAGINDFLPKPMDLDLMASMIRSYCPTEV